MEVAKKKESFLCAKKNGCTGVERGGTVCGKKERGAIYDIAKSPLYRYTDEKFGHLRVAKKMALSIFLLKNNFKAHSICSIPFASRHAISG